MASLVPQSFDGLTLGYTGNYGALFESNGEYGVAVTIDQTSRPNGIPIFNTSIPGGIARRVALYRPSNSGVTQAVFNATIKQTFDPFRNGAGVRYLVGTGDDGSTVLRWPCYVQSLAPRPNTIDVYDAVLVSPQPYFEANTATVSAANPATVTNAGTTAALPSLALTTTTEVSRIRKTIGTNAGMRGRAGVPVRLDGTYTGATSANHVALCNGVPIPTYFESTASIWVVIDIPGDGGEIVIDVIWGTGISNPLADNLNGSGDFNFTTSTNTSWVPWTAATFTPSDNPIRAGEFRPATRGANAISGSSYELDDSSGTAITLRRYADGRGRNDADCIVISIPQTTGTTITNLSRQTTGHDASVRSFVRTQAAGSNAWVDAWATSSDATTTASITIPANTVYIAIGIEFIGATTANPTLILTAATTAIAVDTPIADDTTSSTDALDLYDGTITIGSDVITFDQVMAKGGTLTVDAATGRATSSTGEQHYGQIHGSNPARYAALQPGANAVSHTLSGGSLVITARSAWL